MKYPKGCHTVYASEYQFVRVTRYTCRVLSGDVVLRVGGWVCQTREAFDIQVLKGVMGKDHVRHLTLMMTSGLSRNDGSLTRIRTFSPYCQPTGFSRWLLSLPSGVAARPFR